MYKILNFQTKIALSPGILSTNFSDSWLQRLLLKFSADFFEDYHYDELMVSKICSKILETQHTDKEEKDKNLCPRFSSPWMASQQNVTACVVLTCGLYHKLHYNLVQDMDGLFHLNNLLLLPVKTFNWYKIRFLSLQAQQFCSRHIWYTFRWNNVWRLGFWIWVGSDKCLVIINGRINVIMEYIFSNTACPV